MKKQLVFLILVLPLITACPVPDPRYEGVHTLVYGYSAEAIVTWTKASPQGLTDYSYYSEAITGNPSLNRIDNLIIISYRGGEPQEYFTVHHNPEQFKVLCEKHGDTLRSPIGCYAKNNPWGLYHYRDFVSIEVTCKEAFDADHPAGASLLDLLYYVTDTPYRVLQSGYQVEFEENSLWGLEQSAYQPYRKKQLFNTFKRGTDILPEDMTIVAEIYLCFDVLPDPVSPRTIHIKLTADDGTIDIYDVPLTFQKIN